MKKERYTPLGVGLGSIIDGRYPIEKKLGSGSWTASYLALDRRANDYRVVLKLFNPAVVKTASVLSELADDIEQAKSVEHSGVLLTYGFKQSAEGYYYCTQEHAAGRTIRQLVQNEQNVALAVVDLVHCLIQVAEAVAAIHAENQIHGDISHSSVIVTKRGEVKLADHGFKALLPPSIAELRRGNYVKSPAFLAPELLRGEGPTMRSDVYALGILGFELFVGYLPFSAGSCEEMIARIESEPLPDVGQKLHGNWPWLSSYLASATAKDPAQRFSSAEEVLEFLHPVLEQERSRRAALQAKSESSVLNRFRQKVAGTEERANRAMLVLGLGGLLGALIIALVFLLVMEDKPEPVVNARQVGPRLPQTVTFSVKPSEPEEIDRFITQIAQFGRKSQRRGINR